MGDMFDAVHSQAMIIKETKNHQTTANGGVRNYGWGK